MIKKENGKYVLYSKDGKRKLGEAKTLREIKVREAQVNYFKHLKDNLSKSKK